MMDREVKGKEYHTGIHPSLGSVVDRNLIPKRRPDIGFLTFRPLDQ